MASDSGYMCNCGKSFKHHMERTAHAATCPSVASNEKKLDIDKVGKAYVDGRLIGVLRDENVILQAELAEVKRERDYAARIADKSLKTTERLKQENEELTGALEKITKLYGNYDKCLGQKIAHKVLNKKGDE